MRNGLTRPPIDPRAKLICLLGFVAAISLWPAVTVLRFSAAAAMLVAAAITFTVSLRHLVLRTSVLLPLAGFFALVLIVAGDYHRAELILLKTTLTIAAAVVISSSTSPADLVEAARRLGAPQFLAEVLGLTVRYMSVLRDESRTTQIAMQARGARRGNLALLAASGAVAALFTRALDRANRVFSAMLSRGYDGSVQLTQRKQFTPRSLAVTIAGLAAAAVTLII